MISSRTRKILWAKSGNQCAICKIELIQAGQTNGETSVIGEECHIIAREASGPRGNEALEEKLRDHADNLILLCPTHHRMIDENPSTYTSKKLRSIKKEHETEITKRLEPQKTTKTNTSIFFAYRIEVGVELADVACGVDAGQFENDQPRTSDEADMLADFFQNIQDLNDLWSDIGASGRIRAQFDLDVAIQDLYAKGWLIYAFKRKLLLVNGDIKKGRPVEIAYVFAYTTSNPLVLKNQELIEKLGIQGQQKESKFAYFIPSVLPKDGSIRFI